VAIGRHTVPEWHRAAIEAVRVTPGVALIGAIAVDRHVERLDDRSDRATAAAWPGPTFRGLAELRSTRGADVLLDFSGQDLPDTPPLGIWRYGFADGSAAAGGARGTLVRLYRLTPRRDEADVLHEGWYRAQTSEGWGTRSVPARVAPWCARVLRQMIAGHADPSHGRCRPIHECDLPDPPHGNRPWGARIADAARDRLRRQRWTVGIVPLSIERIMQQGGIPEPMWLRGQPSDRFYADPFPIGRTADRIHLLVESYRYRSREKVLTSLDVAADGRLLSDARNSGLPLDASYPFLLRVDGALLCLPETFRARRLAAFRRGAGDTWSFAGELLRDFPVVDATVVAHEGLWWLFCTKQGDEDQTELHLFFAADWRGPWEPHPLNPVKADTRSSRPAGACFVVDGVLYRPAQNCARRYGAGITINRIVHMTRTDFREEPVMALGPADGSPWPDGLHTINSIGGVTVVDGLRIEHRIGRGTRQSHTATSWVSTS
jgi:hypothetical protein